MFSQNLTLQLQLNCINDLKINTISLKSLNSPTVQSWRKKIALSLHEKSDPSGSTETKTMKAKS